MNRGVVYEFKGGGGEINLDLLSRLIYLFFFFFFFPQRKREGELGRDKTEREEKNEEGGKVGVREEKENKKKYD